MSKTQPTGTHMRTSKKNPPISKRFTPVPFNTDQMSRSNEIRKAASHLERVIETYIAEGRERSLAITSIEQAVFWSMSALAREPKFAQPESAVVFKHQVDPSKFQVAQDNINDMYAGALDDEDEEEDDLPAPLIKKGK